MFSPIKLPYNYSDLEPYIDALTVETHYAKHHAGYATKLNAALQDYPDLLQKPLEDLLVSIQTLPAEIQTAVFNNGGQVYNHNVYWQSMSPNGGGLPTGNLLDAINSNFGSFEGFKSQFSEAAATQFGSGWAWLSLDANQKLSIDKTSNADTPLMHGKTPLMTVDVWEHAYYLNYKNLRPDYIEAFWNVVNWEGISKKYAEAVQ